MQFCEPAAPAALFDQFAVRMGDGFCQNIRDAGLEASDANVRACVLRHVRNALSGEATSERTALQALPQLSATDEAVVRQVDVGLPADLMSHFRYDHGQQRELYDAAIVKARRNG